jgi:hypothetical protein
MMSWVADHGIFADGNLGSKQYDTSVLRLA